MKGLLRILNIALLTAVVWPSVSASQVAPPPPAPHSTPCIGFLLPNTARPEKEQAMGFGDVFVDCWGRTIQFTNTSDITSWALDIKSRRLLLVRTSSATADAELLVLTLNPWKEEKEVAVSGGSYLVATCGTVMLFDRLPSRFVNAISGAQVKVGAGTEQIRCDDNGGTVASLQKATSGEGGPLLFNGKILGRTVANFNVSPNGRFIVFNDEDSLCIYDKTKEAKACLRQFDPVGPMSVWDDGDVVATGRTSQGCPLSPRLIEAPKALGWPCHALFDWRNGFRDQMIQFMGTDPQMLPPSLGNFLLAVKP